MESINEATSFYNVIQEYSEGLISGAGKLCISPYLLSHINEALTNLKNNSRSSPVDIPYELKLVLFNLDNILKSSVKIKLIQRNVATFTGPCDLKRCLSLRTAEFYRVSLDNVGFSTESSNLTCLSCSRCTNVFDLFTSNIWLNLKQLTLSYCKLNKIEADCLSYVSNVEYLNLSFNNLRSIEGLELLTRLISLDISYNYFEEVPSFSDESNTSLNELYMSNNNITSLAGLNKLVNLIRLDASNNCIYEKVILVELYSLKHLKWLKLSDNPLCIRKHYRMYVSHFLGTIEPPFEFLLDDIHLSDAELDFIGSSRGQVPKTHRPSQPPPMRSHSQIATNFIESEVITDLKGILKSSNRKNRKGREVIIVDPVGDPISTPAAFKHRKTGVVIQDAVTLDSDPMSSTHSQVLENAHLVEVGESKKNDQKHSEEDNSQTNPLLQNHLINENSLGNIRVVKPSYTAEIHSSPENTGGECQTVEVTVHATQDDHHSNINGNPADETEKLGNEISQLNETPIDLDIMILDSIDLMLQCDNLNDNSVTLNTSDNLLNETLSNDINTARTTEKCESSSVDSINNNSLSRNNALNKLTEGHSSSEDSSSDDELTGDDNLWAVQKIIDSKPVNMFLVLLDTELRERSTISGRTIATYQLAFIQSCTRVKDDPITVELVFSSLLKQKTVRTYIMEFADEQTLMNKMNVYLASRPDEIDEQLTSFLCKSCASLFSVYKTQAKTLCAVCGSTLVTELEKRQPETVEEPLVSSSPQSSIVSSSHDAVEKTSPNNTYTNPSSVSTVSSEASEKSVGDFICTSTPQKYESDVEIISNPSQSSIEILDDRSTPSRKRSSEERHVMVTPALATLEEVSDVKLDSISEISKPDVSTGVEIGTEISSKEADATDSLPVPKLVEPSIVADTLNIQQMTESSSSGSVVTSYEASGTANNALSSCAIHDIPETSVEACETSFEGYRSFKEDNVVNIDENIKMKEESQSDIYSFTNFTDVDHRIKAYLYQYIFHDDTEELFLLVRCHLWKTGGTDYPACFVLSNRKLYIFMHTSSIYGLDASDWLQLQESLELKSIKKLFPLVWNLGIGLQINCLNYFILLFNKLHTDNLLAAFKGIPVKGCDIVSKSSSKVELNLQQVVLTSNYVHDVIDPTILLYTVCSTINIFKDDEVQETMKLGGFVMTANEFYIVLGDLSWLAGSGDVPSIHYFQMMSSLIEISEQDNVISLHFLDQAEAVEVVWRLHCSNSGQISAVIDAMRQPWETIFSEPLQVSSR